MHGEFSKYFIRSISLGNPESVGGRDIPFKIKRGYWVYDTASDRDRVMYSHKNKEQIVVGMNVTKDKELNPLDSVVIRYLPK